jgi:hypothetical protein
MIHEESGDKLFAYGEGQERRGRGLGRSVDFLREAPRWSWPHDEVRAPTEGPRRQNRWAGFPPRVQPRGRTDEVLRSRASGCVDVGSVWRSLRGCCRTSLGPGEARCHPEGAHARNRNNHKSLRATEGSLSGRARPSDRLPFKSLGQAGEVLRSAPKCGVRASCGAAPPSGSQRVGRFSNTLSGSQPFGPRAGRRADQARAAPR